MNTIGLFPADTLSARVIDIVVFNISKKTKVWKVACWKSSDSLEKGAAQQRGHNVVQRSSCFLSVARNSCMASAGSEHTRTTQRLQQPSDFPVVWRSMGCSPLIKRPTSNLAKGLVPPPPRGRTALQLFTAVEADSDPVSPDAAPASTVHNEGGLSQRGLFHQRNGNGSMWRFTWGAYKRRRRRERNPTASKQLNHPVDILGLYRGVEGGGSLLLCFALLTHSAPMVDC